MKQKLDHDRSLASLPLASALTGSTHLQRVPLLPAGVWVSHPDSAQEHQSQTGRPLSQTAQVSAEVSRGEHLVDDCTLTGGQTSAW